ncbi:MAG TPA: (2Fe-2S)-binding protein [Alphaproteobacteria bacterium]|jgi:carbon-monoxide dehydrogenase small subunit|nr:ferredoxin [Rhodospirillaceae bacterium]MDP6069052.1 (2Fe-2S)-binding protein [Alphaproteobacteria bacterium]MDP6406229.1 (2Fe-2S)-binding protein [Alphaproteobacteria bacterium]HJM49126.1 (2Fe-2S)-binding protein [Alphaproteobacteria bacterium]|tara:strand:- start:2167 stop:2637 length:471 start_codon:yes stop_codon:yes gene_type:complete
MAKIPIEFILNGEERAEFVEGGAPLISLLREKVGVMSPKVGCFQGSCGACTVLVNGQPQLACLTLAETCQGKSIETVEGISPEGKLHPVQQALMDHFGAQCGYCTSGMIMAAKALLDHNPSPSREDVVDAISGNICRCTGYTPIINAVLAAAQGGQ